jgi:hypothetical protein
MHEAALKLAIFRLHTTGLLDDPLLAAGTLSIARPLKDMVAMAVGVIIFLASIPFRRRQAERRRAVSSQGGGGSDQLGLDPQKLRNGNSKVRAGLVRG